MIYVCSLELLHDTVEEIGARHVVTLLRDSHLVQRPRQIAAENHLILGMDDISTPIDGYTHPADEHVARLIAFVEDWNRQEQDRKAPIVMHCYAGISRSTAAAFTAACALNPQRSEANIARAIRNLSATAMPNSMLVSIADRLLGRNGRMIEAVALLGPGLPATRGEPFRLDL